MTPRSLFGALALALLSLVLINPPSPPRPPAKVETVALKPLSAREVVVARLVPGSTTTTTTVPATTTSTTTPPTTTEPATTTTEAPAPPPPDPEPPRQSGSVSDAIAQYFPDIYQQAWNVSQCESGHDPSAVSKGGGNYGLFQINKVHSGDFERVTGQPWSQVLDPYANSQYARYLYDASGGWGPWTCKWAA